MTKENDYSLNTTDYKNECVKIEPAYIYKKMTDFLSSRPTLKMIANEFVRVSNIYDKYKRFNNESCQCLEDYYNMLERAMISKILWQYGLLDEWIDIQG